MYKQQRLVPILLILIPLLWPRAAQAAETLPTDFTNIGSIVNTRHNLSQLGEDQSIDGGVDETKMDEQRNQYGEVCVYCHTPHGANGTIDAPLWNRTVRSDVTYQTYDALGTSTLSSTVTPPGANSRMCLTCHDGTTATDSIINMPGSGRYDSAQETTQNNAFLDEWATEVEGRDPGTVLHVTLGVEAAPSAIAPKLEVCGPSKLTQTYLDCSDQWDLDKAANDAAIAEWQADKDASCMACHYPGAGAGANATDFSSFVIGTNLTNDHPVGIAYPEERTIDGAAGSNYDFNALPDDGSGGKLAWYDDPVTGGSQAGDSDERMDKGEIRFYNTGDGPEVECASCHDPHGVPSAGAGSVFYPTFLRTSNAGSSLCQTCHAK